MHKEILQAWDFSYEDSPHQVARICLPHNPVPVGLDGQNHWQGRCCYRRTLQVVSPAPDCLYKIYFGGAMHTAIVHIDDQVVLVHEGGYLPFEVDVTAYLRDGLPHLLMVCLDNTDNFDILPGKPLAELDFCWYGGLYRNVELRTYPAVHITEPVSAGKVAGGGIFIRTLNASEESAEVAAGVHVLNSGNAEVPLLVSLSLFYGDKCLMEVPIVGALLGPQKDRQLDFTFRVKNPLLWDLQNPHLYHLRVRLSDERSGTVLEERWQRFGIRRLSMSRSGGLVLNGQRIRPRGANRHQDHPWVGYAVPDQAQRRDALRLKQAGFDYVRLSHYPQSPAFLEACDELGILVMNSIPGWQFFGESRFEAHAYRVARELVRRDRNHPCVILWELSLNETPMPEAFMQRMQTIGHEEYPGDQMFTCGWLDAYDVFIHSRQHERIHSWQNGDKALVVAEYGDWEYYASNEGFDQKKGLGLLHADKNSRVLRSEGERPMLQQAANFFEALEDTLASPALTDGLWSMFDYPRGYEPARAACGVMDVFRLPKFSYFFYQSQRWPYLDEMGRVEDLTIYIASHWTPQSSLDITVFSNAEYVELFLNEELLGQMTLSSADLPHAPFHYTMDRFIPGTLRAVAYISGKAVGEHRVTTPETPAKVSILPDTCGLPPADAQDLFLCTSAWRMSGAISVLTLRLCRLS